MTGTTCLWCNCDPRAKMPGDVSPHSTWCPRYIAPPPVDFSLLTECETVPVQKSGLDTAEHGGGGADPIQRLAAAPTISTDQP